MPEITNTTKPVTINSIVLTGEALSQAVRFRALSEQFAKEQQALQQEFTARLEMLKKDMEGKAAEVWNAIATEAGISDPEQAMASGAWSIDAQYLEHGYVFLRRNSDAGPDVGQVTKETTVH